MKFVIDVVLFFFVLSFVFQQLLIFIHLMDSVSNASKLSFKHVKFKFFANYVVYNNLHKLKCRLSSRHNVTNTSTCHKNNHNLLANSKHKHIHTQKHSTNTINCVRNQDF